MKKIIVGLGAMGAITAPVAAVVACGKTENAKTTSLAQKQANNIINKINSIEITTQTEVAAVLDKKALDKTVLDNIAGVDGKVEGDFPTHIPIIFEINYIIPEKIETGHEGRLNAIITNDEFKIREVTEITITVLNDNQVRAKSLKDKFEKIKVEGSKIIESASNKDFDKTVLDEMGNITEGSWPTTEELKDVTLKYSNSKIEIDEDGKIEVEIKVGNAKETAEIEVKVLNENKEEIDAISDADILVELNKLVDKTKKADDAANKMPTVDIDFGSGITGKVDSWTPDVFEGTIEFTIKIVKSRVIDNDGKTHDSLTTRTKNGTMTGFAK